MAYKRIDSYYQMKDTKHMVYLSDYLVTDKRYIFLTMVGHFSNMVGHFSNMVE